MSGNEPKRVGSALYHSCRLPRYRSASIILAFSGLFPVRISCNRARVIVKKPLALSASAKQKASNFPGPKAKDQIFWPK